MTSWPLKYVKCQPSLTPFPRRKNLSPPTVALKICRKAEAASTESRLKEVGEIQHWERFPNIKLAFQWLDTLKTKAGTLPMYLVLLSLSDQVFRCSKLFPSIFISFLLRNPPTPIPIHQIHQLSRCLPYFQSRGAQILATMFHLHKAPRIGIEYHQQKQLFRFIPKALLSLCMMFLHMFISKKSLNLKPK